MADLAAVIETLTIQPVICPGWPSFDPERVEMTWRMAGVDLALTA